MDYMKTCEDNAFDLAIVDPPYRDQNENAPTKDMRNNRFVKGQGLGSKPTEEYFLELRRVSREQIIWGANNFQLPQFKGFVAWKKQTISEDFTMSMLEIAALSEGLSTVSKWIELAPQGGKMGRIHPTQKPIKLYDWLLSKYAKPDQRILDTHLGSGSSAIAAHYFGCEFVGIELDEDYYNAAVQRITDQTKQLDLLA